MHLYGWDYKKNGGEYKNFTGTVLIGADASIGASDSTVIGYKAKALMEGAVALGKLASARGARSLAVGEKTSVLGVNR